MKNSNLILLLFLLFMACIGIPNESNIKYSEKHRPQFHFTPHSQWMNDPNGMFYYEGEYHLFFQHYPDSNVWGPMHWGHAVSKNLIHWEHLPIAIYPDSLGYIFSGSAVVDWNNTSGLGTEDAPPLVAIFTYHDPKGWESGRNDFQSQGLAYSTDKGRTWMKIKENPVLPNPGIADFRDPKIIWHEPTQRWIMTLAVWDHVSFYSSPNLIEWTKESDFGLEWGSHAGVWECPDLFEMKVEDSQDKKWVLLVSINPGGPQGGSATQYFVGDFDGKQFSLDSGFIQDLGKLEAFDPEGIVFEDFESGYEKWTATGTAFGQAPAKGSLSNQNPVSGYEGEGLVNSFFGGDASIGTLTSNVFKIDKPYINLKVGGGNDNNTTYIALVVDGKEVRKAVGSNSEKLSVRSWDVIDLIGQEARVKIVDNHKAGWGHINVDQVEFSDKEAIGEKELTVWLDYGADNYAGVTWSDIPDEDGRRLFIGWMSNWQYAQTVPTTEWRSAMTLPRSLVLNSAGNSYRIQSKPVKELESVLQATVDKDSLQVGTYKVQFDCQGSFVLQLTNELDEKILIKVTDTELIFDRSNSGIVDFHNDFAKVHSVGLEETKLTTISVYVDRSSIEIFGNDGEVVLTEIVFPNKPLTIVELEGSTSNLSIQPITSIWQ